MFHCPAQSAQSQNFTSQWSIIKNSFLFFSSFQLLYTTRKKEKKNIVLFFSLGEQFQYQCAPQFALNTIELLSLFLSLSSQETLNTLSLLSKDNSGWERKEITVRTRNIKWREAKKKKKKEWNFYSHFVFPILQYNSFFEHIQRFCYVTLCLCSVMLYIHSIVLRRNLLGGKVDMIQIEWWRGIKMWA